MATKKFIPFKKPDPWLHFHRQKFLVEKYFPCFTCSIRTRPSKLECLGEIQPSADCDTYKIRIKLSQGGVPRVHILSPEIHPKAAIHMYSNGSLCLYDYRDQPWTEGDNLHEKIIPWTAEWLVYYEMYKLDGLWLGPEAPHGNGEKKPQYEADLSLNA